MAAITPPGTGLAYKLLPVSEWEKWASDLSKPFTGHGIDVTDGYIHLSPAQQVLPTFTKYFSSLPLDDIVLLEIDLAKLESEVKWESVQSRDGVKFPHVYGEKGICSEAITRVWQGLDVKETASALETRDSVA